MKVIDVGDGIKRVVAEDTQPITPEQAEAKWRRAYLDELRSLNTKLFWLLVVIIGGAVINLFVALVM